MQHGPINTLPAPEAIEAKVLVYEKFAGNNERTGHAGRRYSLTLVSEVCTNGQYTTAWPVDNLIEVA